MEKVNGGQEWTPSSISHLTHAIKLGGKKGIRFEATWQKPVERSGPWHFIHCQGLRKSVSAARWSGLIRMSLYVDLENRSVVGYAATSDYDEPQATREEIHLDAPSKLLDLVTGEVLFEGPSRDMPLQSEFCPPGTYWPD